MFRSDFYFFDFFTENFSFFENPTSENPKISVTIGFPIVILGRKSSKKPTSDFWDYWTTPDPTVVRKTKLDENYEVFMKKSDFQNLKSKKKDNFFNITSNTPISHFTHVPSGR